MVTIDSINHYCSVNVTGLSDDKIKTVLQNSGLTKREAEIYIIIARHGALTGSEVTKLMKKDKAQVFRSLKNLQAKNFVDSTLEFPTRYVVIPFERILERLLKTRQKEIDLIQDSKEELLKKMHEKQSSHSDDGLEKFVVVKGKKRIYSKLTQMLKKTKKQLSVATTISDLIYNDRMGFFDGAFNHPLRLQIKYRFLVDFSEQNLKAMNVFLERIGKDDFDFKVKNPELGLEIFPKLVAKDNEELLLFIRPLTNKIDEDEVCLWTNCKTIVQTFTTVFEQLWKNSTEIQKLIHSIEADKLEANSLITENVKTIEEKYKRILRKAKKEIMIVVPAKSLESFWKSSPPLKEWKEQGVSVKIMATLTKENMEITRQLANFCEIRHVAVSKMGTTVVDDKYLFQFQKMANNQEKRRVTASLKSPFFTDEFEYVHKMKLVLDDLWCNAIPPAPFMLESLIQKPNTASNGFSNHSKECSARADSQSHNSDNPYEKLNFPVDRKPRIITEQEILNGISSAKRNPVKTPSENKPVFYGKHAMAVIHPPDYLNLPKMVINVFHLNEKSSFGAEDRIIISLWLDTPKGKAFVPVAIVQNRPILVNERKSLFADNPASTNLQIFKKEELQIQSHDNVLFVGWTRPIHLHENYTLPPSCLLFEGYGEVRTGVVRPTLPSGVTHTWEYNGLYAFVTFFHPSAKYSGPGTDGKLARELIITVDAS
jgi:sugar-specific transcriptional regulator TrmB